MASNNTDKDKMTFDEIYKYCKKHDKVIYVRERTKSGITQAIPMSDLNEDRFKYWVQWFLSNRKFPFRLDKSKKDE